MKIEINDHDLKHGLLGLVLAIVEIIRDTLRLQSLKRMESGHLTEEQIDRLGKALMELDKMIEKLKEEQGVSEAVRSVRDGLDDLVDGMLGGLDISSSPPKQRKNLPHKNQEKAFSHLTEVLHS